MITKPTLAQLTVKVLATSLSSQVHARTLKQGEVVRVPDVPFWHRRIRDGALELVDDNGEREATKAQRRAARETRHKAESATKTPAKTKPSNPATAKREPQES